MKLADWLRLPDENGRRRRKYEFARKIGVTPTMITEYAEGRSWPGRERMEAIVRETGGKVTPNDFIQLEAAE